MAYATQQDMIDKYGEGEVILASDRENTGEIDSTIVDAALDDASDEIDAYIGGVCTLPLADPPKILGALCIDIALYKMSLGTVQTDEKRRRYDDCIRLLKGIADGKISLGVSTTGTEPAAAAVVKASAPARIFTDDALDGY